MTPIITTELFNALLNWQQQGERSFDIKVDCMLDEPIKIWVYDYTVSEGMFINNIKDIPSKDELKKKAKQRLQAQLNYLS